jgi:hypothetical protein
MLACRRLIGTIVIDAGAGEGFMSGGYHTRRFARGSWRKDSTGVAGSTVVSADLPRLRDDLEREFQRLQARLAA